MKVTCVKKAFDMERFHYALDCFKAEHYGEKPSYIIMNYETRAELLARHYWGIVAEDFVSNGRKVETLYGIPVAINEGLDFGEVDIV